MGYILHDFGQKYQVVDWYEASPDSNVKIFSSMPDALRFLQQINNNHNMITLRKILVEKLSCRYLSDLNDYGVMEEFARQLESGRFAILIPDIKINVSYASIIPLITNQKDLGPKIIRPAKKEEPIRISLEDNIEEPLSMDTSSDIKEPIRVKLQTG